MRGEEDRIGVGIAIQQTPPGSARPRRILISEERRIRADDLDRVVKTVAREYCPLAAALRNDAEISR